MSETTFKQIVEGLLMAAEKPLSIEEIRKIFHVSGDLIDTSKLREIIDELITEYSGRGIELTEVSSGWRFQVKSHLSKWVNKLFEERPPKYSRALLETLALIAYRQPITRAEIEDIRGVTTSANMIKALLEHEWVRVVGYKEVPGRPSLFATTKKFLDHFNLKSLEELPQLIQFTEATSSALPGSEYTQLSLCCSQTDFKSAEQTDSELLGIPQDEPVEDLLNINEDGKQEGNCALTQNAKSITPKVLEDELLTITESEENDPTS